MRKYFIFFLLFSVSLCLSARDRVINNPAFEVSNTGLTHIARIELNAGETRVYIRTTFIPKWWVKFSRKHFIRDIKSGEKHYATAIIGGEFDKEIYMGASGDSSFVLIFPPLNKTINKIDFGEGDEAEIYGISLDKKQKKIETERYVPDAAQHWLAAELAKAKVKTLVEYDSPRFFSRDTARLVGYIKGYDPRLNFHTGMIYSGNKITNEESPVIVRIYEDGRFEADIPMVHPEYTYVRFKNEIVKFYIEPGQTLSMILSWDEFLTADRIRNSRHIFKDVEFSGAAAQINKELLSANLPPRDYESFQKSVKVLNPEQFKAQQMALWKKSSANVEELISRQNYNPHTRTILRNQVKMANVCALFDYVMYRESELRRDTANPVLKIKTTPSYYDFFQELDFNDQSLLLTSDFYTFINRFEFSTPITNVKYWRGNPSRKTLEQYLFTDLKLRPTKDDFVYLKFHYELNNKLNAGITETERDKLIKEYNTIAGEFSNRYKKYLADFDRLHPEPKPISVTDRELQAWKKVDSVISNYYQLKPNLIYELVKVRSLKFTFEKMMKKEEALPFLTSFEKGLTNPFLAQEARRMFDKSYPVTPVLAYDLPPGKASEIFRKIIDPHKGKMLFIDFWGIYCGPCIASIERNKPIRQKYKDSGDLKFLFITSSQESPQARYDEFVKKQELENTYKLSADDYLYLRQLFKFNGIPRYIVVNKKGQVMNDDFQMHNFEYELKQLLARE